MEINFNCRYRMKKGIALTFLILANTIILVHAAIPHHYHKGIPYLATSAHHKNEVAFNFNYTQPADMRPLIPLDEENIDNCSFATFYLRSENDKQVLELIDFNFNQTQSFLFLFSIPEIVKFAGLPFRQKPYIQSCHTQFFTQSSGLRAPPVLS